MSEKEVVSAPAVNQDPAASAPEHVGDAEKARRGSVAHIDINKNLDAKIQNPLAGIPRQQLLADVEDFARENGLTEHVALLRKGALVAQDPTCFEDIQGAEALDEAEIYALKREITHKWSVPRTLYLTIITCSIGAAVQGWDQEGSNGANLTFPKQFGIGSETDHDKFLVGLINSAPYIGSALIGCWLSDPLNNYFGRRGTIFISAIFCLITPIGGAVTQNWPQLLITRLLLGIGMGIKASTVPIFAAENSPASIRGALTMTWQMWTAFGIWLGTIANLVVGRVGPIAWRLQIGSAFIPAVPLVSLILFCPESPRWYIKKKRYAEAMTSLLKLRNNPIQAARDLYAIHAQIEIEAEAIGEASYVSRFYDILTVPRLRRATGAAFVVMIAQQLCGINIIAFYSSSVFSAAGATDYQALLASFGFGAINFIFAFPAFWTIDTFGRRSLLLFTFPNMAWSLLAAGLFNLLPAKSTAHVAVVAVFIYIFAAFYSPGEGPVPFAYSAEVFPLSHREVGMAFAVATNLFWAAVLGITFPKILESLGVVGAFGLYAGFNIVGFVLIFLWVPETKQRTLEELDYIFAVPSTLFIRYQFTKVLPWWFKRWVLWQKSATLEPLYHFDSPPVAAPLEPARSSSVEKKEDSDAIGTATSVDITNAGDEKIVQS
ncbi:sugar transporter-domain-containing protein [Xylaria sp. FL1042]|nr:sugar transporter-domain-containing protein [Xylaria sp. FL1042]